MQDEKKWTVRKYRKITYELQMEHALAQTPHRNWVIQDHEFDKLSEPWLVFGIELQGKLIPENGWITSRENQKNDISVIKTERISLFH